MEEKLKAKAREVASGMRENTPQFNATQILAALREAESEGRRAGMEEAAKIADKNFGYRNDEVASAIRAAMKEGKP